MKKILVLLSLSALTGCGSLLDAYLMKYDPNEYWLVTDVRTMSSFYKNQCDNQTVSKQNAYLLLSKTTNFANYTEHLPHNDTVKKSSVELKGMAQGLNDMYVKSDKVSPTFCKIKFESIERNAELMQKTIGAKPR